MGAWVPFASPALAAPSHAAYGKRNRVVILGRRAAGKTIYLARLYEALWQGCTLVDGRLAPAGAEQAGPGVVRMHCRATTGVAHNQFMKIIGALREGKWPLATTGNTYAELIVTHQGREHTVTALDYPGEVFRKAFMGDSDDSDANELRAAIDRATAVILLIDPSVAASGGDESHEDTFGLMQAVERVRGGDGGEGVPISIVFTKCDVNGAFLREAGGVRGFVQRHFKQLFRSIERTAVYPSAAVRESRDALGRSVPRMDLPPENVVEPLARCLDFITRVREAADAREAVAARQRESAAVARREASEAERASRASRSSWIVFALGVLALFAMAVLVALKLSGMAFS